MFYVDYKHMMTRRLANNATASFDAAAANTLWLDARDPHGPPAVYGDLPQRTSARDLAADLATMADQHAVYLNAVPLLSGADAEAVRALLPNEMWTRGFERRPEMGLTERVGSYLGGCPGFGMEAEEFKPLLQQAAGIAPS